MQRIDTDREAWLIKRYSELYERSMQAGIYTYTDFHSPAGSSLAYRVADEREVKLWGGAENCERVIVRFGDPDEIGYEEDYPIAVIHVAPKQPKYADRLTHRDYLGALMSLGFERDMLGDIYVCDNEAYVYVCARMADVITEELTGVRHTAVKCERVEAVPESAAPKLTAENVVVSSLRLDGIIAKIWHLSRNEAKSLFSVEEVFVNGRTCANPSREPAAGDSVSVRGHGRFIYDGVGRMTAKDRYSVNIRRYV